MDRRLERRHLLQQPVHQLAGLDHGQRGDVVDGLLRIQRGALPAGLVQRLHDLSLDAQQPELEGREQAARARADDHRVGVHPVRRAHRAGSQSSWRMLTPRV